MKAFAADTLAEKVSVLPFAGEFGGGVFVAATADGIAVGADATGGPDVKLLDRFGNQRLSFFAFDESFAGGVRVGFADADADGDLDLMAAAGPGGGPNVRGFNLSPFGLVSDRMAGDPLSPVGVCVA